MWKVGVKSEEKGKCERRKVRVVTGDGETSYEKVWRCEWSG